MRGRAYVMIFFFWALLTIITPMLVAWSDSLKHSPLSQGNKYGESGPRRMMGYVEMNLEREEARKIEEVGPSSAPTPEDNRTSTTLPRIIKGDKNHTMLIQPLIMSS
ncbi:PREDICTED: uncharacterized protein LOC104801916 [Tarenaya hassleriana]|uniref:uncharacterized protein LOC104801916 n=1 Tax=Tarenaya hassleriana TaxID=28532 RepID=UPI00053C9E72|nr:PREDICTED: uncharacterized protein LOC104801916 [Tarenaya hassleriana]